MSQSHHLIQNRGFRVLIPSLIFAVAVLAYSNIKEFAVTLQSPTIYQKDFVNNYVVGKAALEGVDPYENIADLASRFIGPATVNVFPHPSPYPPPSVLLFMPYGLLSYNHAVYAWHLTQLMCLLASLFLIAKHIELKPRLLPVGLLVISVMLAWSAVAEEFIWGNSMLVLLLPLTVAWTRLRQRKEIAGGITLGVVVSLKLIAWPLFLLLLIKKQFRAALVCLLTIVVANALAGAVIGFERTVYYYRFIPSIVTPLYRARVDNFSLYAVGWRFFDGTGSPVFDTLKAAPLIHGPVLASFISLVLPIIGLLSALYLASRSPSFDIAFGLMLCAGVVCGPLAWRVYLTWLIIPLAVALKLFLQQPKHRNPLLALAITLLLGYPTPLSLIANAFLRPGETAAPFTSSLFTFIPLAAVWVLFACLAVARRDCSMRTKFS
jgi:hypothetical protein